MAAAPREFFIQAGKKGQVPIEMEKRAKGKKVTIIKNCGGNVKAMLTLLKENLGTGGDVYDESGCATRETHPSGGQTFSMVIQGDLRDRVEAWIEERNLVVGRKKAVLDAMRKEKEMRESSSDSSSSRERKKPRHRDRTLEPAVDFSIRSEYSDLLKGIHRKIDYDHPMESAPCWAWHGWWPYCQGNCVEEDDEDLFFCLEELPEDRRGGAELAQDLDEDEDDVDPPPSSPDDSDGAPPTPRGRVRPRPKRPPRKRKWIFDHRTFEYREIGGIFNSQEQPHQFDTVEGEAAFAELGLCAYNSREAVEEYAALLDGKRERREKRTARLQARERELGRLQAGARAVAAGGSASFGGAGKEEVSRREYLRALLKAQRRRGASAERGEREEEGGGVVPGEEGDDKERETEKNDHVAGVVRGERERRGPSSWAGISSTKTSSTLKQAPRGRKRIVVQNLPALPEQKFTCSFCGHEFGLKKTLEIHIRRAHEHGFGQTPGDFGRAMPSRARALPPASGSRGITSTSPSKAAMSTSKKGTKGTGKYGTAIPDLRIPGSRYSDEECDQDWSSGEDWHHGQWADESSPNDAHNPRPTSIQSANFACLDNPPADHVVTSAADERPQIASTNLHDCKKGATARQQNARQRLLREEEEQRQHEERRRQNFWGVEGGDHEGAQGGSGHSHHQGGEGGARRREMKVFKLDGGGYCDNWGIPLANDSEPVQRALDDWFSRGMTIPRFEPDNGRKIFSSPPPGREGDRQDRGGQGASASDSQNRSGAISTAAPRILVPSGEDDYRPKGRPGKGDGARKPPGREPLPEVGSSASPFAPSGKGVGPTSYSSGQDMYGFSGTSRSEGAVDENGIPLSILEESRRMALPKTSLPKTLSVVPDEDEIPAEILAESLRLAPVGSDVDRGAGKGREKKYHPEVPKNSSGPSPPSEEDDALLYALELSKQQAEQEEQERELAQRGFPDLASANHDEDAELEKALQLSKQEAAAARAPTKESSVDEELAAILEQSRREQAELQILRDIDHMQEERDLRRALELSLVELENPAVAGDEDVERFLDGADARTVAMVIDLLEDRFLEGRTGGGVSDILSSGEESEGEEEESEDESGDFESSEEEEDVVLGEEKEWTRGDWQQGAGEGHVVEPGDEDEGFRISAPSNRRPTVPQSAVAGSRNPFTSVPRYPRPRTGRPVDENSSEGDSLSSDFSEEEHDEDLLRSGQQIPFLPSPGASRQAEDLDQPSSHLNYSPHTSAPPHEHGPHEDHMSQSHDDARSSTSSDSADASLVWEREYQRKYGMGVAEWEALTRAQKDKVLAERREQKPERERDVVRAAAVSSDAVLLPVAEEEEDGGRAAPDSRSRRVRIPVNTKTSREDPPSPGRGGGRASGNESGETVETVD